MKNKKVIKVIGIIMLLTIVCIVATGGVVFWALNNPEISTGLKQFASTINDMNKLQQEILADYPADSVQVGINNGHNLTISLVNSNVSKLSGAEQGGKAKEIAIFAKDNYSNLDGIDTIVISLIQQKGAFGFSMSSTNNYVYKLSELQ